MARHPLAISAAARQAFLGNLAEGHTITESCRAAGIGRSTMYEHRQRDEAFALAWHDAQEAGTDRFEEEARRRAIEGTLRPVFFRGEQVGEVREFSDRLLELELKARRPEKYRESFDVRHSGGVSLSSEQLRAAREAGMDPEVEAAAALLLRRLGQEHAEGTQ